MYKFLFILLLCLPLNSLSSVPSSDFSIQSLGLQFQSSVNGQLITRSKVHSTIKSHYFSLVYAPLPYTVFSAGIGIDRFEIENFNTSIFQGTWSFSALTEAALISPKLNNLLSITAGLQASFLNSDRSNLIYSGGIYNPFAGLILSLSSFLDLEAGVKGHIIDGLIKQGVQTSRFSNTEKLRGYGELTLHSTQNGVYLIFSADMSQNVEINWSRGPRESMLSIKMGIILKQDRVIKEAAEQTGAYFPDYKKLKERQKEMARKLEKL